MPPVLSILLILGLNLLVSTANAYSAGLTWRDRGASVSIWLLSGSAVIQAAIGFSSILIFALAFGLNATGHLPAKAMHGAISLWYLAIIFPALGSGLVILIHSWIAAVRKRDFGSVANAAYNTVAMAHNVYGASDGIGSALSGVFDLFGSSSDDDDGGWIIGLAVGIVAVALGGGVLMTIAIMRMAHGRASTAARLA